MINLIIDIKYIYMSYYIKKSILKFNDEFNKPLYKYYKILSKPKIYIVKFEKINKKIKKYLT
ncbi:hypothetical protein crov030 [Cafeteria roenbergensis virus]|uniref:Uncharacterized protein n=1 Tax=Cafeteria roenbergensis virus (strain BV-PW1) TaxID=693272 RepID=E3T4F0_CROVB|nr:hypothetical protein crov030 [Cafeteria roenbergensis virus BV-PW1]ADO67063.1 hypothetical protein crov030 [Cafeteria roenbergensis virus BV-PW1]